MMVEINPITPLFNMARLNVAEININYISPLTFKRLSCMRKRFDFVFNNASENFHECSSREKFLRKIIWGFTMYICMHNWYLGET